MRVVSGEAGGSDTVRWFGVGILVGLLLAGAVVAGGLVSLMRGGLKVEVEMARVEKQVETEVYQAIRSQVPAGLALLKAEVPRQVADQVRRQLEEKRFDLAGLDVPVPPALAQRLAGPLEEAVRTGIDLALQDTDPDALADTVAAQVAGLIKDRTAQFLTSQSLAVQPWPWLSVPIVIVPR